MVQCDHLNPLEVCLKSLIMNPSSHRHFLAPGPPRYEGGGEPSWTAPSLENQGIFIRDLNSNNKEKKSSNDHNILIDAQQFHIF